MKKVIFFLVAFLLVLTGCNKTNNTSNSSKDNVITNSGNNSNNNESTTDKPSSFLYESQLNGAIRQEQNGNDINIIVERDKESVKVDELFSYSADHLIEIYSSSGVYINQANKEVTLNIGFNKFQVLFKNLKNYSEIVYNFNIFRDQGIVTRKVTNYDLKKDVIESKQENGLPTFNFRFYYSSVPHLTYDGIEMPTIITECKIDMHFYTQFYIKSSANPPTSPLDFGASEQFTLEHTFTSIDEVYEVAVDFPIALWDRYHSTYPFSTIEGTRQGFYNGASTGITALSSSYINMKVDYSKFEFN